MFALEATGATLDVALADLDSLRLGRKFFFFFGGSAGSTLQKLPKRQSRSRPGFEAMARARKRREKN